MNIYNLDKQIGGIQLNKTKFTIEEDISTSFDTKELGKTIRLLREQLDLTQAELSKRSGLSSAEISKIESGNRKKIPYDTLIRISPHLNVSIDYLLISAFPYNINSKERYYDYNGKEIDLYKIAKNLYFQDAGLLLLLAQSDFLSQKENIDFFKSWIMLNNNLTNPTAKKLFESFKKCCFEHIKAFENVF